MIFWGMIFYLRIESFLTVGGSYTYGTNILGSNLDIRGVVLEHNNSLYGRFDVSILLKQMD